MDNKNPVTRNCEDYADSYYVVIYRIEGKNGEQFTKPFFDDENGTLLTLGTVVVFPKQLSQ